jgi:hypothetical protein
LILLIAGNPEFPRIVEYQRLKVDFPSDLYFFGPLTCEGRRTPHVIPAKAGIQEPTLLKIRSVWIPAFAGMTIEPFMIKAEVYHTF